MPASVSTPSTSVANRRIPRRIPWREAGSFDGVLVRRVVLGMRRLSTRVDVNKPLYETQEHSALHERAIPEQRVRSQTRTLNMHAGERTLAKR